MVRKMLILFTVSFLLISLTTERSFEDEEKILWKENKKLTWADFKGIADSSNVFIGAMTCAEIKIDESHFENNIPVYKIGCYFIKNKSWKVVDDDYSLAHEQLHFDIGEIYARKIRVAFDSLNRKKVIKTNIYERIFNSYADKCEKYNDLYDNEVYLDKVKQAYWSKKIASELLKLKKWQ